MSDIQPNGPVYSDEEEALIRAAAVPQQEAGEPATPSVAGLSAVPELPVVATRRTWVEPWDNPLMSLGTRLAICDGAVEFNRQVGDHQRKLKQEAQATIAALSAEIERLKEAIQEMTEQKDDAVLLWATCREQKDALRGELAALKAKQVADVEAVMRLADVYARESGKNNEYDNEYQAKAAREALRSHLTKDRT